MIKIILKIKDKGPAPYRKRKLSGSGFVILFAVTISSILLAIALGVANIAVKEVKFSTSAKDTNEAFLAADTGIEYALFHDKTPSEYAPGSWNSTNLEYCCGGAGGTSCAKVSITKDNTSPPNTTTLIISKGYNIGDVGTCDSANPTALNANLEFLINFYYGKYRKQKRTSLAESRRVKKLRSEIARLREEYHTKNLPNVTDEVYESLSRELKTLLQKYPEFEDVNAGENRVAGKPLEKFVKVKHNVRMLSLNDVFLMTNSLIGRKE